MTRVPRTADLDGLVGEARDHARPATRSLLGAAALGLAFTVVAPSAAEARDYPQPCASVMDPDNSTIIDPRLDHLTVQGTRVNVLLPPGYRYDRHRQYPVVYLFHGAFGDEDSWSTQTDLLTYTAHLPDDSQAIVVMPDEGHLPAGRDWVDGTHPQETYLIGTLIPWIDGHYRTIGDRAHRAAAGFSAGGMNAVVLASRHPDLFTAAGSFSGFLDEYDPTGQAVVEQFAELDDQLCGAGDVTAQDIWGDPVSHPMGWVGHDPVYMAHSLHDVSVYIASANGVPCADQADADPFLIFAEQTVYAMSQTMDQALTTEHVAHTTHYRTCGIHLFSNATPDLHEFWPQMTRAFGHRAPDSFDYRISDARAEVWDWHFAADPARAPEFLDVTNASDDGVRLTGSGNTTITTAPLFRIHEFVTVLGASNGAQSVRADDWGRLSFNVNLGRAHTLEQYTDAELAAQAANPHYFTTRDVEFHRGFDHGGGGGCGY